MAKAAAKYKIVNRKCRLPKRPRHKRVDPVLGSGGKGKGRNKPSIRGIIKKVMIINPGKPNSANRKCAQVAVKIPGPHGITQKRINVYIPGEYPDGHGLQVNNTVLVRAGGPKDCSGVKYSVVPGVLDAKPVSMRIHGGSRYGASPKKNRAEAAKKAKGGK
jgi:ribosomal protein S12